MSSKEKEQKSNPSEVVLAFSRAMQEYNLSSISYKGKDETGNEIEVKLESSIPVCNMIPAITPTIPAIASTPAPVSSPISPLPTPQVAIPVATNTSLIKSPMIGVIYSAPKPDAAPFIKVGDRIVKGQDLFIIECMKTMNPVKSTLSGVVKEIYAQNAKPVEYDQQLLLVEME